MRPLQDRCDPSSLDDIEQMFLSDEGQSLRDMFEEFNPEPIGVASLAQVHTGILKGTGQEVAIKVLVFHMLLHWYDAQHAFSCNILTFKNSAT